MKRHKGETSQRKFACFQLLIYMIDHFDVEMARAIADNVSKERPLDSAILELLEN